jgi:hypothetical protein
MTYDRRNPPRRRGMLPRATASMLGAGLMAAIGARLQNQAGQEGAPTFVSPAELAMEEAAAVREANLVLPRKQAAREIAELAVSQRDTCLEACIEHVLDVDVQGDPEMLEEVLQGHTLARIPDMLPQGGNVPKDDGQAVAQGETWLLDEHMLLWAGPVTIDMDGEEARGSWTLQLLVDLPPAVLARLPEGVRPYRKATA